VSTRFETTFECVSITPFRRPRGVDDGRQVVGADRARELFEETGAPGFELRAARLQLGERDDAREAARLARHDDDGRERGAARQRLAHALVGRAVLDEEEERAGVLHDVADLRRRERGVDGDVDDAGELAPEVGDDPFGRAVGEDARVVAAPQSQRVESERDPADAARQLLRGERVPRAAALVVERVGARLGRDRAAEDLDDRRGGAHPLRLAPFGGGRARRQLPGGLYRQALTPPRKISRTSSAIGASL
jgi:hypothetical protein